MLHQLLVLLVPPIEEVVNTLTATRPDGRMCGRSIASSDAASAVPLPPPLTLTTPRKRSRLSLPPIMAGSTTLGGTTATVRTRTQPSKAHGPNRARAKSRMCCSTRREFAELNHLVIRLGRWLGRKRNLISAVAIGLWPRPRSLTGVMATESSQGASRPSGCLTARSVTRHSFFSYLSLPDDSGASRSDAARRRRSMRTCSPEFLGEISEPFRVALRSTRSCVYAEIDLLPLTLVEGCVLSGSREPGNHTRASTRFHRAGSVSGPSVPLLVAQRRISGEQFVDVPLDRKLPASDNGCGDSGITRLAVALECDLTPTGA